MSHIPLELFRDKFQLACTLGRLANVAADVGRLDPSGEAILKAYVAGDRMSFDRKFLSPIEARPTARLVFAANELPTSCDRSDGVWRRLDLVPFRVTIPPGERNPDLADKLLEELPGIFNWAIEGFRRLRVNRRFTTSTIGGELHEDHRLSSDPVRTVVRELFVADTQGEFACRDAFRLVRMELEARKEVAANDVSIGLAMRREFPSLTRLRRSEGMQRSYVYSGVRLVTSPLPALSQLS